MNLRHNKPSFSYTEPSPPLNIKEPTIKRDPMLKYYAQLLVHFVEKTNKQYQVFQKQKEMQQIRQRSQRQKHRSKLAKRGQKSRRKKGRSIDKEQQEYPLQFIEVLLKLCGALEFQDGQGWMQETSTCSIGFCLNDICEKNPQYLPYVKLLYQSGYYIEDFDASQLQ